MAVVAQAQALVAALGATPHVFGPQVWMDSQHGLVAGVFPNPVLRFDFAAEVAVPVERAGDVTQSDSPAPTLKRRVPLLHMAKRVVQRYELETKDAIYILGSTTQLLTHGLSVLEETRPGTLEKLSARKKQSKRPVARTRDALYDTPHLDAHSEQLANGYWVATNNKADEARGVLRLAVELSGLVWGRDFAVRKVG